MVVGAVDPSSPISTSMTVWLCPRAFQTNSFISTIILSYTELDRVFFNTAMKRYVFTKVDLSYRTTLS